MKKVVSTQHAPSAIGPYVQAIHCGQELFVSGQLGIDPGTGKLCEGVEAQAHQSMDNIGAILEASGFTYGDIVKTTIFLHDLDDFNKVNQIYEGYFADKQFPARSCVQIVRLPLNGLVEVECVAVH